MTAPLIKLPYPRAGEEFWPPNLSRAERRCARRVLARARQHLMHAANMERFLTEEVGTDWVYDAAADAWIVPDRQHLGPGRAFFVFRRGGDWNRVVIPKSAVSS